MLPSFNPLGAVSDRPKSAYGIPSKECWIVVDVEADGPCPGLFSMVSLGAVVVEPSVSDTVAPDHFFAETAPISLRYNEDALRVCQVRRSSHLKYPPPVEGMTNFAKWIEVHTDGRRPVFWSDNNGFDWQFVNYYFHRELGVNPFGHSSRRIADFAAGMKRYDWKKMRRTPHTHHPVDDARGNVEALHALLALRA